MKEQFVESLGVKPVVSLSFLKCFPAPCHPLGWASREYIAVLVLKEDADLGCRGEPGVETDHENAVSQGLGEGSGEGEGRSD